MRTLQEIREHNPTMSLLEQLALAENEMKEVDYSSYNPSKEELELKEMCIAAGKRTLAKYEKKLWC